MSVSDRTDCVVPSRCCRSRTAYLLFTMVGLIGEFAEGCVKIRSRQCRTSRLGAPARALNRHDGRMDSIAAPPVTSTGYRALVVDDEIPLAKVLASYLERNSSR